MQRFKLGIRNPWTFSSSRTAHRSARVSALLLASISIVTARGAAAQGADGASGNAGADPFAGVEEMIVTGSGMVGSLTTTSTAVTSFDALKLEQLGISNVSDVAAYTPNLEIRTASATTATFFIRGVGLNDFTANAASAVAVYVDDAPRNLPAIQLGLLYDLEGIEIQKGPQGSGPGRNASAGAIRIHTKKPTGELDGYLTMDYGNYDLVDIEGALEVPIIEDMLSIRSAFKTKTRDGIVTNRCGGHTAAEIALGGSICGESTGTIRPGLERNLNNIETWAARSSLRFIPPVDDMEWTLTGHVDRTDQLGTVGQHLGAGDPPLGSTDIFSYRAPEIDNELEKIKAGLDIPTNGECNRLPPAERTACRALQLQLTRQADSTLAEKLAKRPLDKLPFDGDYNTPGFERQVAAGATLAGEWQIGTIVLKNITGFERYDRERLIDADYSPNVLFEFDIEDDAWQVTQDLRIGSELESLPITWGAGAFYLEESLDYQQLTGAQSQFIVPITQIYTQDTRSFGIFGDLSWDLLDDLTLDTGVRYNWEQKTFDAVIVNGNLESCDLIDPRTGEVAQCHRTDTVDHPTGTLGFTYRFDESREAYLKYSHGWKGQQYNARDGSVATEVTDVTNPEKIDAFEFGMKGSWLDDRISVDGAIFWYSYQDYQVFTFTNNPNSPPVRIVINADDALNFGAELSTTIKPVEGLTADIRFGWLETKFLNFTSSAIRPVPNSTESFRFVFDYNNNQLPNAPRFKVSGGLEYAFDLNRFGRIVPRWDVVWSDDVNFDPSGGRGSPNVRGELTRPDNAIGQEGFALHNVSIRYTSPSEQLEFAIWARNITNEVYKTLAFDASAGPRFIGNLVGDPRTYGVTLKLSY